MIDFNNRQNPLVSICVLTYNSARTIEETLDSVYSQTYDNLELVISDDHSGDNTIDVCNDWISNHKARFNGIQVLTVEKNTGTNKNVNRVFKAAKGAWLKIVAGDDLLVPECVEKLYSYCVENSKEVCISKVAYFGDEGRIAQKRITYETFFDKYQNLSVKGKFNLLLHQCALPTPSMLISKDLLEKIGYLDESYTIYEEWPLFMSILEKGVDIPYIEDETVRYRCENNSLSSTNFNKSKKGESYQGARYVVYKDGLRFYKSYRRPRLVKQFRLYAIWDQDLYYKISGLMNVPNRTIIQKIKLFFCRIISPGTYFQLYMYLRTASINQILQKTKNYLKF